MFSNTTHPRVAVVTGGGRGIGRAIAIALARDGARVFILGRNADRLAQTCQIARDTLGERAHIEALACDICDDRSADHLLSVAPNIDIFVHGAAEYAPYSRIEQLDTVSVHRVFDTIFTSAFRLTQRVLPSMKDRRFGRIIYIGSMAAALGGSGQAAYASAKSALGGLMRSVACEAGKYNITCNLIELGLIDTERVAEALDPARKQQILGRIPSGRAGTPAEAAAVAAFLASGAASYINGASIPVSGGLGLGIVPFEKLETRQTGADENH